MCCCLRCCCCSSDDAEQAEFAPDKGRRSCTDVGFLLVFLLFCGGLGTTTWYALSRGDPYRILYGSDSFGNTCGRRNQRIMLHEEDGGDIFEFQPSGQDMTHKKYMFPMNSTNPLDTVWSCVAECPQEAIGSQSALDEYQKRTRNELCVSSSSSSSSSPAICPVLPVYNSFSLVHRCIPENLVVMSQELARKVVQMDSVRSYLADVVQAGPFILRMCLWALAISALAVFVLRFFAPILIYFIYILVIVVAVAISAALWYSVYLTTVEVLPTTTTNGTASTHSVEREKQIQMATLMKLGESRIDKWLRMDNTSQLTAIGLAVGASLITIFVFFVVWCLLPRGQKMIKLFKEASRALAAMPILLLQPVTASVCMVLVAMYTVSSCFLLYTAGEPVTRMVQLGDGDRRQMRIIETNVTETTRLMFIYQLVGFIWLSEFILACQRLFIAGSISLWYFDSRRKGSGRSAVCAAFYHTLRYHLGSAAVGSFIITLVRIPRLILMYIYAKMKAVENPVARRLLACFICVLSCIERCLNYINYNAYTVIAYSGKSFCPAARTAVNALLDNAVDVAALNAVGGAVLYLTKFIISAITATLAAYQISSLNLSHPWLPVLLVFISAYLISNCFLSVYAMALDTLLLCCVEDDDDDREEEAAADGHHQDFQDLKNMSRGHHARGGEAIPLRGM